MGVGMHTINACAFDCGLTTLWRLWLIWVRILWLCAAMIKIAGTKSNDKINFKEFVDFFYKVDWGAAAPLATSPLASRLCTHGDNDDLQINIIYTTPLSCSSCQTWPGRGLAGWIHYIQLLSSSSRGWNPPPAWPVSVPLWGVLSNFLGLDDETTLNGLLLK